MNNKVAIIILNYLGYEDTIQCVRSILRQKYSNFKILLVDNYSPNNSVYEISKYFNTNGISIDIVKESNIEKINSNNKISLIVADENLGYAHGNNIALRYAFNSGQYDYYWVLNNDTVVDTDTLSLMINEKKKDRYDRPMSNFIYYYNAKDTMQMAGGLAIDWRFFRPYFTKDKFKIDYMSGASYLIDNHYIKENGLMDEEYFLNSEDLEYFYTYKKKFINKYKNIFPFLVIGTIYHKESATQGKYTPLSSYYYTRNLFYSCHKLKKLSMPGLMLFTLYRLIKWIFKDKAIFKSIILAYRDYIRGIVGKVDYF